MRRLALLTLLTLLAVAGCQSVNGPGAAAQADHAAQARATPVVRGRAHCLERIPTPSDATLDVQLIDDGIADAAATDAGATIARMRWTGLSGPPFEFELPYDPTRVRADRRYSLRATLRDAKGRLEFATGSRVDVVPGARAPVEFRLVRIAD